MARFEPGMARRRGPATKLAIPALKQQVIVLEWLMSPDIRRNAE
jgi:hypothetical protein